MSTAKVSLGDLDKGTAPANYGYRYVSPLACQILGDHTVGSAALPVASSREYRFLVAQ